MKVLLAILFSVLVSVSLVLPVFAIANPDSPPSINGVWVYNDLLEAEDTGILIEYYLDYDLDDPPAGTPPPDEVVTEAYLAVFIDTDGTTQLRAAAPYTYVNSGYGMGLVWIYFSAADTVTYSIDPDDEDEYTIWLVGNPTLDWDGDPPKTIAGVDYWMPADADASVLLALRVLALADDLELAWSLSMVEATAIGNRLTTTGEGYIVNVITDARTMIPGAFSSGTISPELVDIDYLTEFGATVTDGTGTQPVTPLILAEGDNTVDITGTGTFIIALEHGTVGVADDIVGGATVTGAPVDLVWGINTITVTLGGTNDFLVTVDLVNTMTALEDAVIGTAFDLTEIAEIFSMSRWMFSGLVWFAITLAICAGVYKVSTKGDYVAGGGEGKVVMLVFDICLVAGALLGMLSLVPLVLLGIGAGLFTGYALFFRSASV